MFKQILPSELNFNAFDTIGKDWFLITAQKDGKANTMTASWGGVGIMWNKPVAYIFIRPQRYTEEFVSSTDKLSLSVLPDECRKELKYFGTVSGRDEDKIAKMGLALVEEDGVPYFEKAKTVFVCRKLYRQRLTEDSFIDAECNEKWYPTKDHHFMYVVEIEKVLVNED